VSRFEELSVFLKEFGYEGVCCLKAEPVMLKLDRDGVAIFWKIERFKCKGVLRMEKVENWNQVCMCCLLENEKRKIAVAVTHLKATQKEFLEELRCRQVLEFTKRYDDWLIQEKPDLTLFVGDLNSTPGNKAWKGLALATLEQRGYKSSWHVFFSEELKNNTVATYCSGSLREVGLYDYIFYTPFDAVSVKGCEGPRPIEGIRPTTTDNPSDHLFLLVNFQFKKEPLST